MESETVFLRDTIVYVGDGDPEFFQQKFLE